MDDNGRHVGDNGNKDNKFKKEGLMNMGFCGPDCPMHPNAFTTDETLKVTHHYDQKEMMVVLKLYGILSSSLLLIGLIVLGLGSDKI